MRALICAATMACVLTVGALPAAEAREKKKKAPPSAPAPRPDSRFAPELAELYTATSGIYELNGKPVGSTLEAATAASLRALRSNDPKVRELGRMSCEAFYLRSLLMQQAPDAEIERVAKAGKLNVEAELLQVLAKHTTPAQLAEFGLRADFMERVRKAGVERGGFVNPETLSDLEKKLIKEIMPDAEKANRLLAIQMVGRVRGHQMREKMLTTMSDAIRPAPAAKTPIAVKLETAKDNKVVLSLTNQSKEPLHHCLIIIQTVADPKNVEKLVRAKLSSQMLAGAFLGVEDKKGEMARAIFFESILRNMEGFSFFYVPEIPASGMVKMGLTTVQDMVFVKSTSASVYCDELTIPSLDVGKWAGFAPELAGTPIRLNSRGTASIPTELARTDPRDPASPPTMLPKVCKVFTLRMAAGKTYVIETVADRTTGGLQSPPTLRVENESGEAQTTTRDKTPSDRHRIQFKPAVAGDYRIVCTEGFGPLGKFTLAVQQR